MSRKIFMVLFSQLLCSHAGALEPIRSSVAASLSGTVTCANGTSVSVSSPTLQVDCTNARVGVGTPDPQTTLHVIGLTGSRAIMVNSPDPAQTQTAGATVSELAMFGTSYSASQSSMLDLLAYSSSTVSTSPHYRITNHWEGTAASGTIAIGFYQGSNFTDVLSVATNTNVGIGTNSPVYPLHTVGAVYATGQEIVGGSTTVQGAGTSMLGPLTMGPPGVTATTHRSPITTWATSIDGATQSSGCVVALVISADSDAGVLQFTSTTTANVTGAVGVLFSNSCTAGSVCRVAYSGLVRTIVTGSATVGGPLGTSTTRCQSQAGSQATGTAANGRILTAGSGAGSWVWALLGTD